MPARRCSPGGAPPPDSSQRSCLLLLLPNELQLVILRLLEPVAVQAMAAACATLATITSKFEHPLWLAHLTRNLVWPSPSLAAVGICLHVKRLFCLLFGARSDRRIFEVRGLSLRDASVGEMKSWWRCTVVGLEASASRRVLRVRCQYHGYSKPEDIEWRALEDLRPFEDWSVSTNWRKCPRHVEEELEVSWAMDGHPVARWCVDLTWRDLT